MSARDCGTIRKFTINYGSACALPSGDPENTPLVECDAYADAYMIRMRYEDDASLGNPAGNPAHRKGVTEFERRLEGHNMADWPE